MKCCEAQVKQVVQVPFLVFRKLKFFCLSHASKAAWLGTVFRAVSSALSQKAAYNIYQPHILHHHPPSRRLASLRWRYNWDLARPSAVSQPEVWWSGVCARQRQGKMATQESEATKATVSNGEVKWMTLSLHHILFSSRVRGSFFVCLSDECGPVNV